MAAFFLYLEYLYQERVRINIKNRKETLNVR